MGFREDLIGSPLLYPVAVDLAADGVQFLKMPIEAYEAAGFLDRRMISPGTPTAWGRWAHVSEAATELTERCHFIFHISHVGSTLLSRLLGAHPKIFSLREPAVLRVLADAQLALGRPECPWSPEEFERRLSIFLGLWSRTYKPEQTALIKATSYVSEMAEMLTHRSESTRSIFMYVAPRVFLMALLGGAMSDIDGRGASRLDRLQRRLNTLVGGFESLSPGERVAMSWLSEMMSLHAAAKRFPARCLWVDFDVFLADPQAGLLRTMEHLGLEGGPEVAKEIIDGPNMKRYAKAQQFEFDAGSRAKILQESLEKHGAEVAKGEAWLVKIAEAFPAAKEVLEATCPTWPSHA